jgi:hypothetical protein
LDVSFERITLNNYTTDDFQRWAEENDAAELPALELPSGNVSITDCATKLFRLIAPTKQLFGRGGAIMSIVQRDNGLLALEILRPAAARSFFEKYVRLFVWRAGANRELVLKPTNCPEDMAEALLHSREAFEMLPRVRGLLNCPVLYEINGELVEAIRGYDENTRLLITDGGELPSVQLDEAVLHLLSFFLEFDFQTEGDRARALASLITPALKTGNLFKRRVPVYLAES